MATENAIDFTSHKYLTLSGLQISEKLLLSLKSKTLNHSGLCLLSPHPKTYFKCSWKQKEKRQGFRIHSWGLKRLNGHCPQSVNFQTEVQKPWVKLVVAFLKLMYSYQEKEACISLKRNRERNRRSAVTHWLLSVNSAEVRWVSAAMLGSRIPLKD